MRSVVLFAVLVSICLLGCGVGQSAPEPEVKTNMQLRSTSLQANQPIPSKYTQYGANVSPELEWSGAPQGTKSFVLLLEDPDAPGPQPFVHWLAFNIPTDETEIKEGVGPERAVMGQNTAGTTVYYGPKPPSGTHHYHFEVFAVDEMLPLKRGATKDMVMKAVQNHTLGKAELVAPFSH